MVKFIKKQIKKKIENYVDALLSRKLDEYSVILAQLQEFHSAPKEMLYSHVEKKNSNSRHGWSI